MMLNKIAVITMISFPELIRLSIIFSNKDDRNINKIVSAKNNIV